MFWPVLLLLHIAVAMLGFGLGPARIMAPLLAARFPRSTRIVLDWYPLLTIPLLYTELAILNLAVWNGHFFDPLIIGWEETFFGGQPSRELAKAWPVLPLSELLHGAYLSYYFIIYGPPLILYLNGRYADFRRATFGVMLTFFLHYIFFIYFPVQGPRYLFPAPSGDIAGGPLYNLTHKLLEAGSSRGAAFPSSHVGVAVAQTALTYLALPRLAIVLTPMTALLALGAVYGGFHYATDAVAGLLLGLACVMIAPAVRRWLSVRA